MKTIDILLQGEAIADVQLITLGDGADLAELLVEAAKQRSEIEGDETEFLAFLQEEEVPLKMGKLPRPKTGQPLCIHVHRCRKISVEVTFNGQTKNLDLAPSRTVGATKTFVAVKLFDMSKQDAAEHVLQIAGETERPDADIHIGSLAHHCKVAFDLVPLVRVEG
ncbi:MAG: hypothetical protein H6917_06155 [Novosphingobium sp.]|nr:hypothetical protein [Novosphingobium sp.]MCP5401952.1 hypothetical protein [Novosphingobium sp.]